MADEKRTNSFDEELAAFVRRLKEGDYAGAGDFGQGQAWYLGHQARGLAEYVNHIEQAGGLHSEDCPPLIALLKNLAAHADKLDRAFDALARLADVNGLFPELRDEAEPTKGGKEKASCG